MSTDNPRHSTETRSQIEHLLSLRRLTGSASSPDQFSNQQPLACPPWARGAYGGQLIAQSLLAAYETVPNNFVVHSIHCHFMVAADVDLSMTYHVDRVRDGKSFATRVINARQDHQLVMSATASFTQESTRGNKLQHAAPMPREEPAPDDRLGAVTQSAAGQGGRGQPCDCVRANSKPSGPPHERRLCQWVRARGRIEKTPLDACGGMDETGSTSTPASPSRRDNHHAHLAALAYMTDNYFIGTASRVHNGSRFSNRPLPYPMPPMAQGDAADEKTRREYFDALAEEESRDNREATKNDKHVGMMASLDHTIYFHHPRSFRADEWLLAEMESPWADDERAVVMERIWNHQGLLVATCIQEGVVRLSQHGGRSRL
ncbi:hypothetical protein ACJZ2D_006947 [Fusarium nematophilum]